MKKLRTNQQLFEREIQSGYSVRSGAYSVVDEAIEMRLNEFGEYEPNRDAFLTSTKTKELISASSMANVNEDEDTIAKELFSKIKGIKHHSVIGYYSHLYAGHVTEGNIREVASSGGMTTWILTELLKRKLIDGVIHLIESKPGQETLFEYGISKSVKQVIAGAKTKYYPGEFSKVLSQIKKDNATYAIVGIPSLVMEVRLLAKQDPEIAKRIKFTLGLICGHQKSTKYAESLAWQSGIKPGDLLSIDFRKKVEGRPANLYATEMTGLVKGKKVTIVKSQEELFGTHWGYGFFKTQLSDFTDDALNETADVALGDAWLPEYVKDSLGTNIVIVRNKTIASIIQEGMENGKVKLDTITEKDILKSQPGLIHHTRDDLPYRLYKKDKKGEWRPKKRLAASKDIPLLRRIVQDIRQDIAIKSKLNYKKAVELEDWDYFQKSMKGYLRKYRLVYVVVQIQRRGLGWFVSKAFGMIRRKLKV